MMLDTTYDETGTSVNKRYVAPSRDVGYIYNSRDQQCQSLSVRISHWSQTGWNWNRDCKTGEKKTEIKINVAVLHLLNSLSEIFKTPSLLILFSRLTALPKEGSIKSAKYPAAVNLDRSP